MYESRFGITGPPFQLGPDPDFYFDSQSHRHALTVLRNGLFRESGCVVVSGEIGAGKTTLIRKLVGELETSRVSLAHVVSTQLDADELLVATLHAFGIEDTDSPRKDKVTALLRHLLKLEKQARRAVLIIDEAQNLAPEAFAPLISLATRTTPRRLPFQLCLVGQPELRALLQSAELANLRGIVSASCHLGPLDERETASYIEHRLKKVGWTGVPSFQPEAFEEIHRWSDGVPRRINLLCNRLMMGQFLTSRTDVDRAAVVETARQFIEETGEPAVAQEATAHAHPRLPEGATGSSVSRVVDGQASGPPSLQPGCVLCLVAGQGDCVQAVALAQALAAHGDVPEAVVACVHGNEDFELIETPFLQEGGTAVRCLSLDVAPGARALGDEVATALDPLIDRLRPAAVIVFDGTPAALAGATLARRKDVPVVHVGAGTRCSEAGHPRDQVARATDALADLLYTTDPVCSAALESDGIDAERIHGVGSLLVDALRIAMRPSAEAARDPVASAAARFLPDEEGYALVLIGEDDVAHERQALIEIVSIARAVSRDIAVLWPMHGRLRATMSAYRLESFPQGERIIPLPAQPYRERAFLMAEAACVLTDSREARAEATALGVPCLTIGHIPGDVLTTTIGSNVNVGVNAGLATRAVWQCLFSGGQQGRLPELWDGRSGVRIANYLAVWLSASRGDETPAAPD